MDDFIKDLKSKNKEFSDEYIEMMKAYYQKLMNNPSELQNTLNSLKNSNIDSEGGITIVPDKYCCIKTTDENNEKIFINLVSSDKVDPPAEQHILEMNNQHGVRIPLSLSEPFEDHDIKGNLCQVFDAIFNPNTLKKTESEPLVLNFIMQVIAGRIKERFKKTINVEKFVRMKNLIYKGNSVRSQRIRARKVKIDEIINNSNEKDENLKNKNKNNNNNNENNKFAHEINKEINEKGKTPNWNFLIIKSNNLTGKLFKEINKIVKENILANKGKINYNLLTNFDNNNNNNEYEYYNGFNANPNYGNGILLCIELELLSKSSGINLNISDESLTMYCGKFYSLEINLPFKINSNNCKSIFNVENRILFVYLPFYEKDIQEFIKIKKAAEENEKNIKTFEEMKDKIGVSEDYLYDVVA